MISKDRVFGQMVGLIGSVHQLHYDLMKDMPMTDITPLQYEILEFLVVKPPQTLSQISECKGLSMPNASREIRRLTELGLCEKIEDATDRRKQYIRLSALGQERMGAAFAHMKRLFLERTEEVTDEEWARISEAIGVLAATVLRPAP